ncbi:MAG TPA: hypothetical protein VNM48_01485 [Chloroflexota bacterium]|nr:hypothetical protein [Chloroflexota bacterium]
MSTLSTLIAAARDLAQERLEAAQPPERRAQIKELVATSPCRLLLIVDVERGSATLMLSRPDTGEATPVDPPPNRRHLS